MYNITIYCTIDVCYSVLMRYRRYTMLLYGIENNTKYRITIKLCVYYI